ncbi:hypothetical protein RUND412_004791 [Rhizina undulata]
MAPNSRSSTDLNFSVLSRHVPRLDRIIAIASYAVLYEFSPSAGQDSEAPGTWGKAGIEGVLFVCALSPPSTSQFKGTPLEEYQLIILNRRGMENFVYPLKDVKDIDFSEAGSIINIRSTRIPPGPSSPNGHANGVDKQEEEEVIYGLWVHSEPGTSTEGDSSRIAKIISECASNYAANQAATRSPPSPPLEPRPQQQPSQLGRSISLADLFQQPQSADASGFGLHSSFQSGPPPPTRQHQPQQFPFPSTPQYNPQPHGYPQDPAVMALGGVRLGGETSGHQVENSDVLSKLIRANDARYRGY